MSAVLDKQRHRQAVGDLPVQHRLEPFFGCHHCMAFVMDLDSFLSAVFTPVP
jgi:hypothetical protein